jgi:hypothetical protein
MHRLAERAEHALHAANYPKGKSLCQSFARTCYEREYGDIFHDDNPSSAHEAEQEWKRTKYARPGGNWGQIGDLLYFEATPGNPFGHVGIRIPGNLLAENSVLHYGKDRDGRGTRPLSELGRFPSTIVRLPAKRPQKTRQP